MALWSIEIAEEETHWVTAITLPPPAGLAVVNDIDDTAAIAPDAAMVQDRPDAARISPDRGVIHDE